MAENSKIEWTDHTFNPWVGCTKVSPACDHCYAEGWAKRTGNANLWQGERRRTSVANWKKPLKWDEAARLSGVRAKVFCASLADVFDNQADPQWRCDLWTLIEATPNLDWLLLTKRPQNIAKMLPVETWGTGWPNVWLGTTIENREEMFRRAWHLKAVPAFVSFWSVEPMLGPLGHIPQEIMPDWIICGGESGPGARRPVFFEDYAAELREQCEHAGSAFFMKQMPGVRKPLPPIPPHLMVRQFPKVPAHA